MFSILPASRARRTRPLGGTVLSLGVHGALIAGAVALTLTKPADANVAPRVRADSIVYVVPTVHEHLGPRRQAVEPSAAPHSAAPIPPLPLVDVAPRLPSVELVVDQPLVMATDPGMTRHAGVLTEGSLRHTGEGEGGEVVISTWEADRAPRLLGMPQPRYPEVLRAAGITGRVVVEFVVDTAGRSDPSTLVVVSATRDAFVDAVRSALRGFRFVPGEAGGRRVRTRVQMPFDFTLQ